MEVTVAVLAGCVLLFGACSALVDRSPLTAPIVFTLLGALLGEAGLGVVDLPLDGEAVSVLTEVTLVLVLFTDAARIDLTRLRRAARLPARMLGSLPVVIALGTGAGLLLLGDLDLGQAALLAAVLAPTDAALGQAVVNDERLPVRIRQTLNVESGLNDGIVVPFVTILIALAGESASEGVGGTLARMAAQLPIGVVVGLCVGAGGARLVDRASTRGWMTGSFQQLATLACALLAASLSTVVGGNEFVAAFVGGMAFGAIAQQRCGAVEEFAEEEGRLLTLLVFTVFGATIAPDLLEPLGWSGALYVVASLTVVRMVPIALSLVGTGLRPDSVAFLGWFGPRGLASILFVLLVVEELGESAAAPVASVAAWTVAASILAHGLSAVPLVGVYSRRLDGMSSDMPEMAPTVEFHVR